MGLNGSFGIVIIPNFCKSSYKVKKYLDSIIFANDKKFFYSYKNAKTLFQIIDSK